LAEGKEMPVVPVDISSFLNHERHSSNIASEGGVCRSG